MKTRELTGMTVTEVKALSQDELFPKLVKFCKGRQVTVVTFDFIEEGLTSDGAHEAATVVWC